MVLFLLLFQSKRTKLGSLVDFSIRFIDDIIGVDILVDAVVFGNDFWDFLPLFDNNKSFMSDDESS